MKNLITIFAALSFSTLMGCGGPTLGEACDQAEALCYADMTDEEKAAGFGVCLDYYFESYDAKEFQSCAKDAETCEAIAACFPTVDADTDDTDA
jgi:hypothetical protein